MRASGIFEVVILFRGLNDNTAAHELLYCIGIPHSFSEENIEKLNVPSKTSYIAGNIMDYSDMNSKISTISI